MTFVNALGVGVFLLIVGFHYIATAAQKTQ